LLTDKHEHKFAERVRVRNEEGQGIDDGKHQVQVEVPEPEVPNAIRVNLQTNENINTNEKKKFKQSNKKRLMICTCSNAVFSHQSGPMSTEAQMILKWTTPMAHSFQGKKSGDWKMAWETCIHGSLKDGSFID
jgi:hypothetical protein